MQQESALFLLIQNKHALEFRARMTHLLLLVRPDLTLARVIGSCDAYAIRVHVTDISGLMRTFDSQPLSAQLPFRRRAQLSALLISHAVTRKRCQGRLASKNSALVVPL